METDRSCVLWPRGVAERRWQHLLLRSEPRPACGEGPARRHGALALQRGGGAVSYGVPVEHELL